MISHRIDNDEVNPGTECGVSIYELSSSELLASIHETPTCKECQHVLAVDQMMERVIYSNTLNSEA